jgi:hypothetical protein
MPRTTKDRNQYAETWQRLADIRLSVPGYGYIRVKDLLQQVSVADTDPQSRDELARQTENLATLLESLPPPERDAIVECITDVTRETYERNEAG